ncbi:MAG: hypothetical protein R2874_02925 [Desulfobacterales bacterium]
MTAVDQHPPIITADHAFTSDTSDISTVETVLYQHGKDRPQTQKTACKAARMLALRLDLRDGVAKASGK